MSRAGQGGSYYLIVIGSLLALMGGVFVYLLGKSYLVARETHSWPETTALILESSVQQRQLGPSIPVEFSHRVLYRYDWEGQSLSNDHLARRENPWSQDREKAMATVASFPLGSEVPVFVNPADPSEAVLRHDTKAAGYSIWFPGLFVVGGLGVVVGAIRRILKAKRES